ncbi:type 1 glutamine amidotransferase domain-containing protein [Roseisolibacter sp. H3M3-2]|uniref:type 1 glutamine amidotransferase domain-containing protein n=1 Tax=Roseisolibacter sp. H3M3-2 TaxID=3031323 RepID=UPI0023DCB68B|nr:type 1 glutamine amidotransferase domain-containing protein [Roseisolibacter sp. H3M3-2]MDF1502089.1 type 1 glutamine amidotransferase [Roseisolibacter sp. H3M3-2]
MATAKPSEGGALKGRRVAVLATDGVELVELVEPVRALEAAGAEVDLVSLEPGEIQGFNHLDKAEALPVDRTVDEVRAGDYDGLVIPGGVANPDRLREDERAVALVRDFIERDKPVAAICHGPWLLVEADAVRGRTLTSWPSLKTDIRNAGGEWEDRETVLDQRLLTSRKPADLPAFCEKLVGMLTTAVEERSLDRMVEQTFPASDPLPGPSHVGGAGASREGPRAEA